MSKPKFLKQFFKRKEEKCISSPSYPPLENTEVCKANETITQQVNNQTRRPKNDSQTKLKRRWHQYRICYNCRKTGHFGKDCHRVELYLGINESLISASDSFKIVFWKYKNPRSTCRNLRPEQKVHSFELLNIQKTNDTFLKTRHVPRWLLTNK